MVAEDKDIDSVGETSAVDYKAAGGPFADSGGMKVATAVVVAAAADAAAAAVGLVAVVAAVAVVQSANFHV